jgi:hypothetical protein
MTDGSDQMRKSTSTAVPVSTAHQAPDLDYDFMKYNATEWRDHAREVAGEILQRLPEAERAWGAKRRSMIRILTRLIIDEERPARTPTRPAQQLWRWLFPREPWPRGSTVRWVRSMRNTAGLTDRRRCKIFLSYADAVTAGNPVAVLVHEFVHVRAPPCSMARSSASWRPRCVRAWDCLRRATGCWSDER